MSVSPLVSSALRFVASDSNTTRRPSSEIDANWLSPLLCVPSSLTLMRTIFLVVLSRTKMSRTPLVSPGTRLVAVEWKAIHRPSAESDGAPLDASAWTPVVDSLARLR